MLNFWSRVYLHIWAATRQSQQNDCAPNEDSDQAGHSPSLIRAFDVRMKKPWVLSYLMSTQQRLWSDWADAQTDLNLRWAHMPFRWFCHEAAHLRCCSCQMISFRLASVFLMSMFYFCVALSRCGPWIIDFVIALMCSLTCPISGDKNIKKCIVNIYYFVRFLPFSKYLNTL